MLKRYTDGKTNGKLAVIEELQNGDLIMKLYEDGKDSPCRKIESPSRKTLVKLAQEWVGYGEGDL